MSSFMVEAYKQLKVLLSPHNNRTVDSIRMTPSKTRYHTSMFFLFIYFGSLILVVATFARFVFGSAH